MRECVCKHYNGVSTAITWRVLVLTFARWKTTCVHRRSEMAGRVFHCSTVACILYSVYDMPSHYETISSLQLLTLTNPLCLWTEV